jgi:IS5 family transposase
LDPLFGRCDSFVVETDVHYPTDINLLWDAIRKVIELTSKLCDGIGISEWRQYQHHLRKIKGLFNKANRLKASNSKDEKKKARRARQIVEAHQAYIGLVVEYLTRVRFTLAAITEMGMADDVALSMLIEGFMAHADRQIDQIRRRVIKDEKIPHAEKVFSLFEEHTEWISKGKAGVPQEL